MSWRNSSRARQSETTVSTSGNVPQLPSVDLSRAIDRLQLHEMVDEKSFKIKVKGSIMLQTMIFTLADRDNITILENVASYGKNISQRFDISQHVMPVQDVKQSYWGTIIVP